MKTFFLKIQDIKAKTAMRFNNLVCDWNFSTEKLSYESLWYLIVVNLTPELFFCVQSRFYFIFELLSLNIYNDYDLST
jgi:hypothetical protein